MSGIRRKRGDREANKVQDSIFFLYFLFIIIFFLNFFLDPPKKPRPYFLTTPHKIKSLFRQLMENYLVRK